MLHLILDAAAPGAMLAILGGGILIIALIIGLLATAITLIVRKVLRKNNAKTLNQENKMDPDSSSNK